MINVLFTLDLRVAMHRIFSFTEHANINADFYAWSDHDDIWRKYKIMRAVKWLEKQPKIVQRYFSQEPA
jgi:hypothetical protein